MDHEKVQVTSVNFHPLLIKDDLVLNLPLYLRRIGESVSPGFSSIKYINEEHDNLLMIIRLLFSSLHECLSVHIINMKSILKLRYIMGF